MGFRSWSYGFKSTPSYSVAWLWEAPISQILPLMAILKTCIYVCVHTYMIALPCRKYGGWIRRYLVGDECLLLPRAFRKASLTYLAISPAPANFGLM